MSNMIDFLVAYYCEQNKLVAPTEAQELENASRRNASDDSPSTKKARRKGANDT